MIREFCAENLTNVREALIAGADRVELCEDLRVGGVSPSEEVMQRVVGLAHELGGRVMVMVRPRGGDFAYGENELRAMERIVCNAREAGADGVVFGCVRGGELDVDATRRIARAAEGLDMTFHMAFDEIREELQPEAISLLASMGLSRVLTHGGSLEVPIEKCLPHLKELVGVARGQIVVMPGGGVTWENADDICSVLGVSEVHGTRIVHLDG